MKYINFRNYSNTFIFDTKIDWPTFVIFWWIHWDEIAWVKVIGKIVKQLENDEIKLLKWKLILAYGNEKAIKLWKRQIKYNLNRIFKEPYISEKKSEEYEIKRVQELKEILDYWDILLDIHSTSSESEPFMFAEKFLDELEIAEKIWTKKIIIWWEKIAWNLLSWDTNSYMHNFWKKAFTLECWKHDSKDAFTVWYNISIKFLEYLWIIKENIKKLNSKNDLIEMYKIAITKTWKFQFSKNFNNFDNINKWDLIGYDWNDKIIAKENFIILLPNYWQLNIWEEIFYYWRKIN